LWPLVLTWPNDLDAEVIRHFCETQNPETWQPPAPEIKALRALTRRIDDLIHMRTQASNRLQSGSDTPAVQDSIRNMIANIDQQITQLEQQKVAL